MATGLSSESRVDGGKAARRAVQPGARALLTDLIPALSLLLIGLVALLAASVSSAATDATAARGQYLVVLPPWSSAGQTFSLVAAADGAMVQPGRFPNIAVAASFDKGFADMAREAGAWIVVPSPLLAGCGQEAVR